MYISILYNIPQYSVCIYTKAYFIFTSRQTKKKKVYFLFLSLGFSFLGWSAGVVRCFLLGHSVALKAGNLHTQGFCPGYTFLAISSPFGCSKQLLYKKKKRAFPRNFSFGIKKRETQPRRLFAARMSRLFFFVTVFFPLVPFAERCAVFLPTMCILFARDAEIGSVVVAAWQRGSFTRFPALQGSGVWAISNVAPLIVCALRTLTLFG